MDYEIWEEFYVRLCMLLNTSPSLSILWMRHYLHDNHDNGCDMKFTMHQAWCLSRNWMTKNY